MQEDSDSGMSMRSALNAMRLLAKCSHITHLGLGRTFYCTTAVSHVSYVMSITHICSMTHLTKYRLPLHTSHNIYIRHLGGMMGGAQAGGKEYAKDRTKTTDTWKGEKRGRI